MKKTISLLLLSFIILTLVSCTEKQPETPVTNDPPKEILPCCERLNIAHGEGDTYQVVTVGECLHSNVIIPSTYNGAPVTKICDDAFQLCEKLESITIPQSVTVIGRWVFYLCTALKDIYYQGTVEQWNAIEKGVDWDLKTADYTVHCSNGDIAKNGTVTIK